MVRIVVTQRRSSRRKHRRNRFVIGGLVVALAIVGLVGYQRGSNLSADDYLVRAESLFEQGERGAALIEVKNALKTDPTHAESRVLAGRLYLLLRDGLSAEKELSEAVDLGIDTPEVHLGLLRAFLYQGRSEEVIGRLLAQDSESGGNELHLIRGEAWLGVGKYENARADFERVLDTDPENVDAHRGLTRLALATKDIDEADRQVEQTLGAEATDLEAWVLQGEVPLLQKDYQEAESAFSTALQYNEKYLLARIGLTRALLAQGKPDEALQHIEVLTEANPYSAVNAYLAALAARQQGDVPAMQFALREVLKVAPNHPAGLLMLGAIHYRNNELELAHELLSRFVDVQPDDLRGSKLLAAVLIKQKEYERGIALLEKAAATSPDEPQLLALLGSAYMANKNYQKANELMARAAELQPDISAIRTQLALTFFATGDADKGVSELQSIVAADPEFERADYLLLLVHLRKREYQKALVIAQRLAGDQPENPVPQNLIAAAHEGLGNLAKARAAYERALSIKSDYGHENDSALNLARLDYQNGDLQTAEDRYTAISALNLARLDYQNGDLQTAEDRYTAILVTNPENVFALEALARFSLQANRTQKAIEYLERARAASATALSPRLLLSSIYFQTNLALALEVAQEAHTAAPDTPAALQTLARAQLLNRNFAEAQTSYQSLIAHQPRSADFHHLLGLTQAGAGETQSARESWSQALALNPDHLQARLALARLQVVDGELESALESARVIQKQHPTTPVGLTLEGDIYSRKGDHELAVATYQAAQKLQPQSVVTGKIATAYRRLGDIDTAISTLASWLDNNPNDHVIRVALAAVYQGTGNADEALKHYNRFLNVNQDNAVVLDNVAWIYFERRDPRALETAKRAYELVPERPEIADTYGWFLVQDGRVEKGLSLLAKYGHSVSLSAILNAADRYLSVKAGHAPAGHECFSHNTRCSPLLFRACGCA